MPMPTNLKLTATAAQSAAADPILAGIVLPAIITQILNLVFPQLATLFTSCFGPTPTPATVQQTVAAAWDGATYSHAILRPVIMHEIMAGHRVGQHLTHLQGERLAIHTLDATRLGDTVAVQEMLAACQAV